LYTFEVSLGEQVAPVAGDRSQLQQVLLNLCLNARDAMEQGGAIGVALRIEGKKAVLEVSDHGKGIPVSDRERVFEPFFTTKPAGRAGARPRRGAPGGEGRFSRPPGRGAGRGKGPPPAGPPQPASQAAAPA